jgi:hypothetical protein
MLQGVCNDAAKGNKQKAEPVSCITGSPMVLDTFSWRRPAIEFNIPVDSLKKMNGMLSLWVKEVTNPGLVQVSFNLLFSDSHRQWPLPGFTLYPPDKTGVFNFNISETVKDILKTSGTKETRQFSFHIMLDTTDFHKNNRADAESLLIKICSPVFK